jgi:sterol desaturase/sphingolipid hydroxylase (fatty acid hydroxylase superfamily)
MSIPLLVLGAGLSFVFLGLVFWPLEKAFPARPQPLIRPEWWMDLLFFLGQYLLWGGSVLAVLEWFRGWLDGIVPAVFRAAVGSQPWWMQVIEVILLSDMLVYWGHRLQHRVGFLWRFHSIHHSAEHLDWLAAHREHPLDTVYTMGLINLPAFIMGFPLEALAGLLAFRGIWAIYIHSNVRLPLGRLRMLVGAPELHHWHHSREREAGNYANISPLMDLLFGTYHCPAHEPEALGVHEPMPRTYWGQLLYPFYPKECGALTASKPVRGGYDTSPKSVLLIKPPVEMSVPAESPDLPRDSLARRFASAMSSSAAARSSAVKSKSAGKRSPQTPHKTFLRL